jgi:predicted permease
VIRHWLVQGLLLAFVGGAIGVTLAVLLVRLVVSLKIGQVPRLGEVRLDLPVFGFAALVTILAGLGFGLAPSLTVREGRLRGITAGHGGMDQNPRATRLRSALVVLQVALCFVLLVGAGLAVRSLRTLLQEEPGFDPEGLVNFQISLPQRDYRDPARRDAFFQAFTSSIRGLPGVSQVGLSSFLPFRTIQPATGFAIQGEPDPGPGNQPVTQVNEADEAYFPALGIPLLSGRLFVATDRQAVPRVVLVNRALSRMLGGERAALGRQLKVHWRQPDSLLTVIGVVGDVRVDGLDAAPRPMVYFPLPVGAGALNISVRAAGNPLGIAPGLHRFLEAEDPGLPLLDLQTMNDRLDSSLAGRRYPMALLSGLGLIALVLAAVGLYGVLSYAVTQRQRELGLRRAIGASEGSVVRLVLSSGFRLAIVGLVIGLVAALGATRYLSGLLYETSPRDVLTFLATGLVVGLVTLLASLIPARRAARVDPVVALRGEGR